MAIQFQCQNCKKWLEVDDENAGGKAVCPYCQSINTVTPVARPAGQMQPQPAPLPASPPMREEPAGQRWEPPAHQPGPFDAAREGLPVAQTERRRVGWLGPLGLIASVLGAGLLFVGFAMLVSRIPPAMQQKLVNATDQVARQEAMQELNQELMRLAEQEPQLVAAIFGGVILLVVGFILSLLGAVLPGPRKRGWAYAGMAVGGVLLLVCLCSGIMQSL